MAVKWGAVWDSAKSTFDKARWGVGKAIEFAKAHPVLSAFVGGLAVAGTVALLL